MRSWRRDEVETKIGGELFFRRDRLLLLNEDGTALVVADCSVMHDVSVQSLAARLFSSDDALLSFESSG